MPLSLAPTGQVLRLIEIHGGIGVNKRLNALGLTPGTEVTIISNNYEGPIILAVKDSRLAVGRGLLHHIFVEPQEQTVCGAEAHAERFSHHRHHRGGRGRRLGRHRWES